MAFANRVAKLRRHSVGQCVMLSEQSHDIYASSDWLKKVSKGFWVCQPSSGHWDESTENIKYIGNRKFCIYFKSNSDRNLS